MATGGIKQEFSKITIRILRKAAPYEQQTYTFSTENMFTLKWLFYVVFLTKAFCQINPPLINETSSVNFSCQSDQRTNLVTLLY